MAKLLSNETWKKLQAVVVRKPPSFSGGHGVNVAQQGTHFIIAMARGDTEELDFTGNPPISSSDYGSGPGSRLSAGEGEGP